MQTELVIKTLAILRFNFKGKYYKNRQILCLSGESKMLGTVFEGPVLGFLQYTRKIGGKNRGTVFEGHSIRGSV